jgi:hypothetical protein
MNVLEKDRQRGENRVDNSTQNPSGGGGDNILPGRDFLVRLITGGEPPISINQFIYLSSSIYLYLSIHLSI